MTSEYNNNKLLPPTSVNKKTLVLDLDETLVHSQFIKFSTPSDVIIKIDVENAIHDIHVMVRPGVKEFLEEMEKYYEIVIFTASVSKYADPLLDIIDKKGLCPFRLFREHCTLINMTFVKDLQKLGRDIKNIVIVDNSPLSYALHPENGLPIQTWFEDKSDKELYQIIPILKFLSKVPDVREFIPKFVDGGDKINYEASNIIINNYNNKLNFDKAFKNIENNKRKKIEFEFIKNAPNKVNLTNGNNDIKNNRKKEELSVQNIIASVKLDKPDNHVVPIKENTKSKFIIKSKKKEINNNISKKKNSKNFIKIDTNKIIINSNTHNNIKISPKNTKKGNKNLYTETNLKKRKNNSASGNLFVNCNPSPKLNGRVISFNPTKKCNILNSGTPKINKIINVLDNKINHFTKSVKFTKKTNSYIFNSNNNKIHKSKNKDSNKNKIHNKSRLKIFTSLTNPHPIQSFHKKQYSYVDFRTSEYLNKLNTSKNKKLENNTVRSKISLDNNISFNNKFNRIRFYNLNNFGHLSTTRDDNSIKFNISSFMNYSPKNKIKFNYSIFHNDKTKFMNFKKFKYNFHLKQNGCLTIKNSQTKANDNNHNEIKITNENNHVKSSRTKSSNLTKRKIYNDDKKNKVKFINKNKIELGEMYNKRGKLTKDNILLNEIKKS